MRIVLRTFKTYTTVQGCNSLAHLGKKALRCTRLSSASAFVSPSFKTELQTPNRAFITRQASRNTGGLASFWSCVDSNASVQLSDCCCWPIIEAANSTCRGSKPAWANSLLLRLLPVSMHAQIWRMSTVFRACTQGKTCDDGNWILEHTVP